VNTEIPVTLTHAEKTDSILLGYTLGSAGTTHGRMDVIGSGRTVRFILEGAEGHVDLDLSPVAALALDLLTGAKPEEMSS